MAKPDTRVFLRNLACALFLSVFVFIVSGDPITDALFPHQGACDICDMLAGGHGVMPADAGPVLLCDFTGIVNVVENTSIPVPRFCPPVYLSRAPPSSI